MESLFGINPNLALPVVPLPLLGGDLLGTMGGARLVYVASDVKYMQNSSANLCFNSFKRKNSQSFQVVRNEWIELTPEISGHGIIS